MERLALSDLAATVRFSVPGVLGVPRVHRVGPLTSRLASSSAELLAVQRRVQNKVQSSCAGMIAKRSNISKPRVQTLGTK